MTVPVKGAETEIQVPRWRPGAYRLANYAKSIKGLVATDDKGVSLKLVVVDDMTWKVENPAKAKSVIFQYEAPAEESDQTVHFGGAPSYAYVVGRKLERCVLTLDFPSTWKVAIGLDPDGSDYQHYSAPTYDVLADTPVTLGEFILDTYTVEGKPHLIAIRSAYKDQIDRAKLMKACKFISEMDARFFGGLPYKRYVWHLSITNAQDGGGGLEHLNGTEITLAKGLGYRSVGVLSHEYFHLWNVKRIRSRVLGPFDYTQLPQTGALWWLEGVTDYYAHSLLRRNGWSDDTQYFGTLASNLKAQRSRPGRLQVSPYDSSFRVRDADNGLGNSQGYLVSYYDTGWLLGFCLDVEILSATHGRRSLDDVELALWKECRNNQPGFPEDEIRKLCERFGGEKLGSFYDQHVMQPGDLPVEEEAAKVGLEIVPTTIPTVEVGFVAGPGRAGGGGIVVRTSDAPDLKPGDVIQSIGSVSLIGLTGQELGTAYRNEIAKAAVGTPIKLSVLRDGLPVDVSITPKAGTSTSFDVHPLASATPEAVKLRAEWLAAKR
jgi:predicted metalloprotease with PDZ domain